jgi:hypothetical protein
MGENIGNRIIPIIASQNIHEVFVRYGSFEYFAAPIG